MFPKKNRTQLVVLSLCLAFALTALGYRVWKPRAVQASNVEIKIDNFSFAPTDLVVKSGTRITWTNRDDIPHTVVEDDKLFKSKVLDTGEQFTFSPTKPGIYKYYCSIHPKMTAKIVVE
ncbi:MAG TPA: cupredoxin family copper-binding protein [Candidatus Binatia bacterium]|nr:cupredoxin family copper-binding protein [Candidatus Binatia bacterium]